MDTVKTPRSEYLGDVKSMRKKLYAMVEYAQSLPSNRELSMAITNMQYARMELGNTLKYCTPKNPYEEYTNMRKRRGTKDIAPTSDMSNDSYDAGGDMIEISDRFREDLKDMYKVLTSYTENSDLLRLDYDHWFINHLEEAAMKVSRARNCFGLILERIRDGNLRPDGSHFG